MIEIDKIFPVIKIDGKEIAFSKREFELFSFLWENRGRVCTRNTIQNSIWGLDHFNSNRITDITIARVRKKLVDTYLGERLLTRKGFGYLLVP